MKSFFQTFVISCILIATFLFFGGYLIFENVLATILSLAFITAILVTTFMNQETRIEALEMRIKALETQEERNK